MKKISLFALLFVTISLAQVEIPQLKSYANDLTNTLNDSELSSLNSTLKSFDDSTSNQIVFLMISSLDGYPLESYCNETAAKNKVGSQKNNNGVLFFVSKEERKMRIEVGYGLEGALPDALASSILRNEVRPYFKQGDYYGGISAGIESIIKATRGEYKADKKSGKGKSVGFSFIFILILFIVISLLGRKGGKGGGGGLLPLLILSSMGSRNRGSWGGGSSGGGFSGGGGSFGGGGASGSW
jgi:uncharacterized protein